MNFDSFKTLINPSRFIPSKSFAIKLSFFACFISLIGYQGYSIYDWYMYPSLEKFKEFKKEKETSYNDNQVKYQNTLNKTNSGITSYLYDQNTSKNNIKSTISSLLDLKKNLCIDWYYKNIYDKIIEKKKDQPDLKIKRLDSSYQDRITEVCKPEYFIDDIKNEIKIPEITADMFFPDNYTNITGKVYTYKNTKPSFLSNVFGSDYSSSPQIDDSVTNDDLSQTWNIIINQQDISNSINGVAINDSTGVKTNSQEKPIESNNTVEPGDLEFLNVKEDSEESKQYTSQKEMWLDKINEYNAEYSSWKINNLSDDNLSYVLEKGTFKISQTDAQHFSENWILATDLSTNGIPLIVYVPKAVDLENPNYHYKKNRLMKDSTWILNSGIHWADNYVGKFVSFWLNDGVCKLEKGVFVNCKYEIFVWHMSEMFQGLKDGDIVKTWQPIWISGGAVFLKDNGVTTGPHIHVEKRVFGLQSPYFPLNYNNLDYESKEISDEPEFK